MVWEHVCAGSYFCVCWADLPILNAITGRSKIYMSHYHVLGRPTGFSPPGPGASHRHE